MPAERLPAVEKFTRAEFLAYFGQNYHAGEHVTLLGPTGTGKTTLSFEMLGVCARPELPGIVMVVKPKDPVVAAWGKALKFPRTKLWPAANRFRKPPGWLVWPPHTYDPDTDDAAHRPIFRRTILGSYKAGNRILFADEVYGLANDLKLHRELITVWMRARSMGTGLWTATQKPTHIPLQAYSQAEHILLHYDPDKRARERYEEIGGISPKVVAEVSASLPKFHYLYIRRTGPVACIVGP